MIRFRFRVPSAWLRLAAVFAATFALASSAATLQAQVLTDPRIAEFDPSPDHWSVLDSGDPAVLRYELGVYPLGSAAPVGTVDLGKPAPDSDGKIRYDFSGQVAAWSLPGGEYEARVSAIGPQGAAASDPSNPFTFSAPDPCTYALSASTVWASASGGSYSVNVANITGSGCEWAVASSLPWVTVSAGGGTGDGTVPFVVQANPSTSGRTGAIQIAGQALTIIQDAAAQSCSYSLSPTSASVPAAGGSVSFGVVASTNCAWTAVASDSWIGAGVGHTLGTGAVSMQVAPNPSTAPRTGTVTVQGQTFTITQSGAVPTCSYSVSPASASLLASGGSAGFIVTAGAGCSWTATTAENWIAVSVASGSGNGTVSVTVAANSSTVPRTGTVKVQGQVVTISQGGADATCSYGVSQTSFSFGAGGGSATVTPTTGPGCTWTVSSSQSWLVPSVTGGSGSVPFTFTVKANNGMTERTAALTVGPWVVTVSQSGKARRTK